MERTFSGRLMASLLFLPLGVWCLAILVAAPFMVEDIGWWLICVELPLALATTLILLNGYASWTSRITIRNDGLSVRAPQWRATPLPPMTRLDVPWSAVRAIRHRVEFYRVPPFASAAFPVHVYAIDTDAGRAVFGGRYGLKLDAALRMIASRAGCGIKDEGKITTGILGSLIRGSPAWRGG